MIGMMDGTCLMIPTLLYRSLQLLYKTREYKEDENSIHLRDTKLWEIITIMIKRKTIGGMLTESTLNHPLNWVKQTYLLLLKRIKLLGNVLCLIGNPNLRHLQPIIIGETGLMVVKILVSKLVRLRLVPKVQSLSHQHLTNITPNMLLSIDVINSSLKETMQGKDRIGERGKQPHRGDAPAPQTRVLSAQSNWLLLVWMLDKSSIFQQGSARMVTITTVSAEGKSRVGIGIIQGMMLGSKTPLQTGTGRGTVPILSTSQLGHTTAMTNLTILRDLEKVPRIQVVEGSRKEARVIRDVVGGTSMGGKVALFE
jgi:hypothetical protein